jgi:hypothetical protein
MIKFIYKIFPVYVRITDKDSHMDSGADSGAKHKQLPIPILGLIQWIVIEREEWARGEAALQHELQHCRDNILTVGSLKLLRVSKKVSLWTEVRAYRKMLEYEPCLSNYLENLEKFAGALSNDYGFKITYEEALERLS